MNPIRRALVMSCGTPLISGPFVAAAASSVDTQSRPQPVGRRSVHYLDETRQSWDDSGSRPIQALIWYPATANALEADWEFAIFKAGRSAHGATMTSSPPQLPLIVLSHGTGGSAATLAWLGESLAANGYLVAAVNHHGNTSAEAQPSLQGTLICWDRPRDLSVLIDRLLADPSWGPRIDASRIGVAGFSIGGYSALASVGVRLSRAQWQRQCTQAAPASACKLPPEVSGQFSASDVDRLLAKDRRVLDALAHVEDDYRDPRIKAALAMAPVMGPLMTRQSLAAVAVPVKMVVGANDDQAEPGVNAEFMAKAIPDARLDIFPQVTHYCFLPPCNDRGRSFAKALCTDPADVCRAHLHPKVAAGALEFFGQVLLA